MAEKVPGAKAKAKRQRRGAGKRRAARTGGRAAAAGPPLPPPPSSSSSRGRGRRGAPPPPPRPRRPPPPPDRRPGPWFLAAYRGSSICIPKGSTRHNSDSGYNAQTRLVRRPRLHALHACHRRCSQKPKQVWQPERLVRQRLAAGGSVSRKASTAAASSRVRSTATQCAWFQGTPLSRAHRSTSRCPPSAAEMHMDASKGQPCWCAHCSTARLPPYAAKNIIQPSQGQPCWCAQRSTARWPLRAAELQVVASQGHPCRRSHFSSSRWPHFAAALQADAFQGPAGAPTAPRAAGR
jgi:hypothetical protein